MPYLSTMVAARDDEMRHRDTSTAVEETIGAVWSSRCTQSRQGEDEEENLGKQLFDCRRWSVVTDASVALHLGEIARLSSSRQIVVGKRTRDGRRSHIPATVPRPPAATCGLESSQAGVVRRFQTVQKSSARRRRVLQQWPILKTSPPSPLPP